MSDAAREIEKLGIEVYDGLLERDEPFTVMQAAEKLDWLVLERFGDDHSVGRELLSTVAHQTIQKIDRSRTKPAPQESLFSGLDRSIPVAEAKRIARRYMRFPDWAEHLAHVGDNAANVNASAAKENHRFSALSPYLSQGMNTEAAINAWQVDHPDDELP